MKLILNLVVFINCCFSTIYKSASFISIDLQIAGNVV